MNNLQQRSEAQSGRWAAVLLAACPLALVAVWSCGPARRVPTGGDGAGGPVGTAGTAPSGIDPLSLPTLLVDRDNVDVSHSCRLTFIGPIADADRNGVVHVSAPDIYIDLGGETLAGADTGADHAALDGIGVSIAAPRVRLGNGSVRGFKVGVLAEGANGGVFEDLNLSGNYAQHLASDFDNEATADWLSPHDNDAGEWHRNFGAGLCIRNAKDLVVRRIQVRRNQNGIILDRVNSSSVYDNDCSFLSGWGIALWRASNNTICRNYFDFCVRGYSHGVYNRGQDSAGILLFEQCNDNLIALNSATHCGDGLFGFAGREALGERPGAGSGLRLGCNGNRIEWNDFSFSAAHGMEMTFSFGNIFERNRCAGNAICGLWAGYSRASVIRDNLFTRNGETGSGDEHGGINIEHGRDNHIEGNLFRRDTCGVRLWDDSDPRIASTPWGAANGSAGGGNVIAGNEFVELPVAIRIDAQAGNCVGENIYTDVGEPLQADSVSKLGLVSGCKAVTVAQGYEALCARLPGATAPAPLSGDWPASTRAAMGGRDVIVIFKDFPIDPSTPTLVRTSRSSGQETWRLLGAPMLGAQIHGITQANVAMSARDNSATIFMDVPGTAGFYEMDVRYKRGSGGLLQGSGAIAPAEWDLRVFRLPSDPSADPDGFAAAAKAAPVITGFQDFRFPFGGDGPAELGLTPPGFPTDNFGLHASADIAFPAGCWILAFRSDDGLRVRLDGATIIDRWDRHSPTDDRFVLEVQEETIFNLEVDYFELDGNATLLMWVEHCTASPTAASTDNP